MKTTTTLRTLVTALAFLFAASVFTATPAFAATDAAATADAQAKKKKSKAKKYAKKSPKKYSKKHSSKKYASKKYATKKYGKSYKTYGKKVYHSGPHYKKVYYGPSYKKVYYSPPVQKTVVVHHASPAPVVVAKPVKKVAVDERLGVYFGVGGISSVMGEDSMMSDIMGNGGGIDLFFGARFSPVIALEVAFQGTSHDMAPTFPIDSAFLSAGVVDLKVFPFPGSTRLEPFLLGGMGIYNLHTDMITDEDMTGFGYTLGVGTDLRLSDVFTIGLTLAYNGVFLESTYFDTPLPDSDYMDQFVAMADLQIHF